MRTDSIIFFDSIDRQGNRQTRMNNFMCCFLRKKILGFQYWLAEWLAPASPLFSLLAVLSRVKMIVTVALVHRPWVIKGDRISGGDLYRVLQGTKSGNRQRSVVWSAEGLANNLCAFLALRTTFLTLKCIFVYATDWKKGNLCCYCLLRIRFVY